MKKALFAIRYVLILTSVISTVYISPPASYAMYTFFCLLYIAVDVLHLKGIQKSIFAWLVLFQIIYITFLGQSYGGFMYLLYLANLFYLRLDHGKVLQWLLAALQWAIMNVIIFREPSETFILVNLMYIVFLGILIMMEGMKRQSKEIRNLYDSLRNKHYELEEARTRIIEYAKKIENTAQIEERSRISNQIHDELGHQLIRTKLMAETMIHVVPQDLEKGMSMLYRMRDQLSESMETLRATVRTLKPAVEAVKSHSLQKLAADFSKDSGVDVAFESKGQPFALFPSVEIVLYRNAQEALTNAVRHGHASRISIQIHYLKGRVELIISNDGTLPTEGLTKGLGLRGMEERIELLGGSIQIEMDNVFKIKSIVPFNRFAESADLSGQSLS